MLSLTERVPGLRSNDLGLPTTYGERFARLLRATAAVVRFWLHGRTVTVTRSVSLVVFLTVNLPTDPRLAVISTVAGEIETPPCWAVCARGAESCAWAAITSPATDPTTARLRAPATSRLLARFTSRSPWLLFRVVREAPGSRRLGGKRDQHELVVVAGRPLRDLLAQLDADLRAGHRVAPPLQQRIGRAFQRLEGSLADRRLQRRGQATGAGRDVPAPGSRRRVAVGDRQQRRPVGRGGLHVEGHLIRLGLREGGEALGRLGEDQLEEAVDAAADLRAAVDRRRILRLRGARRSQRGDRRRGDDRSQLHCLPSRIFICPPRTPTRCLRNRSAPPGPWSGPQLEPRRA